MIEMTMSQDNFIKPITFNFSKIGEEEMKAMALDVAVQKAIDFVVEASVEK